MKKENPKPLLKISKTIAKYTKKYKLKTKPTSPLTNLSYLKVQLQKHAITLSALTLLAVIFLNTSYPGFSSTPTPKVNSANIFSENPEKPQLEPTNVTNLPNPQKTNPTDVNTTAMSVVDWESYFNFPRFYEDINQYTNNQNPITPDRSFSVPEPSNTNNIDTSNPVNTSPQKTNQGEVSLEVVDYNSASVALSENPDKPVTAKSNQLVPLSLYAESLLETSYFSYNYLNPTAIDTLDQFAMSSENSVQVTVESSDILEQPTTKIIVGVNIWSGTSVSNFKTRDVPLLNQAGIKHLRIGTGVRDSFIDAALVEGIDVIGTFSTQGLPNLEAFGDYVYNRVAHFKERVKAWVVFNEANYDGFRDNPKKYTQALKTAYTKAKEADPNILIVTSNFLSTEGGLNFLKEMYQEGAKGYFDVLGIDPYCYPEPPTEPHTDRWNHSFWRVPQLYNLMVQNGDGDKPVWIVEFGYRTSSSKYPLSHSTVVSEADQAQFIIDALELAQTWPWLERFYIYEWMDSSDVKLGKWGLIKENYKAPYQVKPAYEAVKQFIASQTTN